MKVLILRSDRGLLTIDHYHHVSNKPILISDTVEGGREKTEKQNLKLLYKVVTNAHNAAAVHPRGYHSIFRPTPESVPPIRFICIVLRPYRIMRARKANSFDEVV